jgi:putative intracellular protease/amidase
MDSVAALLFDGFELLDVFGPMEAFGHLAESGKCRLITGAERAGAIASRQGPRAVADHASRRLRPRG